MSQPKWGQSQSVSAVCRRYGISRQTYHRYRRRYLTYGIGGLVNRSRAPQRSPGQIEADLEIRICKMRKDHPRWGARRIHAELGRAGLTPPAVSTIHQALVRNHLVALQPPRRPKALKRFEREVSNDLWQIDATEVRLADQRKAWVMDMLDDHSRYLLAAIAATGPTGEAAWDCFEPRRVSFRLAASSAQRQRPVLHREVAQRQGRLRTPDRRSCSRRITARTSCGSCSRR